MAFKRKRTKEENIKDTDNAPQVNEQFASSDRSRYCLYLIGSVLLIIIVLYFIITKNELSIDQQSLDNVIVQIIPSKAQIEIAERHSHKGDLNALKQFANNNKNLNWTYIQYSGSSSTDTLLHLALQGLSVRHHPL